MNEYYNFLGVDENASDGEIEKRYAELKKKYEEDRWLDGEAGNEGAQNLTKLENAYAEIKAARAQKANSENGSAALDEVAAGQVFNGDHVDELAQLLVDLFENRAVSGRDDRHLRKTRVFGLVDGQA